MEINPRASSSASSPKASEFNLCLLDPSAACLQFFFFDSLHFFLQVWEGHWRVQLWPVSEWGPVPESPQQIPLPVRRQLRWGPLWDRCKRPLLFCLFALVAESLPAPLLPHPTDGWWASSRVGWSGRLLSTVLKLLFFTAAEDALAKRLSESSANITVLKVVLYSFEWFFY